jgi:hypothetical protein
VLHIRKLDLNGLKVLGVGRGGPLFGCLSVGFCLIEGPVLFSTRTLRKLIFQIKLLILLRVGKPLYGFAMFEKCFA